MGRAERINYMASYIHARWRVAPSDTPVEFYSELDAQRFETRKIEIFADGRVGYASSRAATQDTRLAIEPLPTIVEIRGEGEFDIKEITKADFDAKWKTAGGR
jgi:HEAT repeat protein